MLRIYLLLLCIQASKAMVSSALFRLTDSGMGLVHHVFRKYKTQSALECVQNCLAEHQRCESVNFFEMKQSGFVNCELNNATKSKQPSKFEPLENVKYYEMVNLKQSTEKQDSNKKDFSALNENTSFHANFTNLGESGRLGPASLDTHYAGKDNENMVTVKNGIQFWTVPHTGTYEITAVGAAGGYLNKSGSSSARGRGAYIRGEFDLKKGDVLKILVGQEGIKPSQYSTSGGGGTFVSTSSNAPIIVTGGGGGTQFLSTHLSNCDASKAMSGKSNACVGNCSIWSGGVNGNGATQMDDNISGGGGGGFNSNGSNSKYYGYGGQGFIHGGEGGISFDFADGGFGGGGGGGGKFDGGELASGGGGGYSGGAPGDSTQQSSCGGGGGSFNNGKNQFSKEGYRASGHGFVEIKRLR